MRNTIFYIGIIAIILSGCSSDEPSLPEEQPTTSENLYLEFNQWVYSQMNHQYLWREDMPDSIECNFDLSPKDFFQSLLSTKDRFSYFTDNPSYSGGTNNYGFEFQRIKDKNNKEVLEVLYVTSPNARIAGLRRGDYVEFVFGRSNVIKLKKASIENNKFIYNGDYLEFTIDDITGSKSSVLLDTIYSIENHRIGYLCYLEYKGIGDLYKPIQKFADNQITDLILDLRYNSGGYVSTCQYLCNCIVPSSGYGNIFQQCSYNNILSLENKLETGDERTFSFFDFPTSSDKEFLGVSLLGLQMQRLYVITSSHTASASEATIVCLRPYMEVITIGETTVGKGVGSWNISNPKYQYSIQPITMRYYNADNFSTPDAGIVPDYFVPDGNITSKKEIGDTNEELLSTAISLIIPNSQSPTKYSRGYKFENSLTPIGEPSYVTEYKNKHYNESN